MPCTRNGVRIAARVGPHHPLAAVCFPVVLLTGSVGVPRLVDPQYRVLAMVRGLGRLAVMMAGWSMVRVLACRTTLDAALDERCRG